MYDQSESDLLRMLADRAGIGADYYDIAGTHHVTTDETRRAILVAMNLRVSNREELIAELEDPTKAHKHHHHKKKPNIEQELAMLLMQLNNTDNQDASTATTGSSSSLINNSSTTGTTV